MAGPPYLRVLDKWAWGPAGGTLKTHPVFDSDIAGFISATVTDTTVQTPITSRDKPRVGSVYVDGVGFSLYVVGSGTAGTPPPDADLLKACGLSETVVAATSVTYSADGNLNESADGGDLVLADAAYYAGNGLKFTVDDAIADVSWEFLPGEPAKATYKLSGIYTEPTNATSSETAHTAATPVVCTGLTIAGHATSAIRRVVINLNNTINSPNQDIAGTNGVIEPVLTDQVPTAIVEFRAPSLVTVNPPNIFTSENNTTLQVTLGSTAGNIVQFSMGVYISEPPEPVYIDDQLFWRVTYRQDFSNTLSIVYT